MRSRSRSLSQERVVPLPAKTKGARSARSTRPQRATAEVEESEKDEEEEAEEQTPPRKKAKTAAKVKGAPGAGPSSAVSAPTLSSEELEDKYSSLRVTELKEYLRANGQHMTGNKPELVQKCVDGERFGAIPPCPACKVGKLRVEYMSDAAWRKGEGHYSCKGYYDESVGFHVSCPYHSVSVVRLPWRAPGEEPAPVELDEELFNDAKTHGDGAAVLVALAHKELLGGIPSREEALEQATKAIASVPGAASLREAAGAAYPKLQLAWSKVRGSGPPKDRMVGGLQNFHKRPIHCTVPSNGTLANTLDELGDYMALEQDPWRAKTFHSAALSIATADEAITSGKEAAKMIDGLGTGTAKRIDEILASGTLAQLEEFRTKHPDAVRISQEAYV